MSLSNFNPEDSMQTSELKDEITDLNSKIMELTELLEDACNILEKYDDMFLTGMRSGYDWPEKLKNWRCEKKKEKLSAKRKI